MITVGVLCSISSLVLIGPSCTEEGPGNTVENINLLIAGKGLNFAVLSSCKFVVLVTGLALVVVMTDVSGSMLVVLSSGIIVGFCCSEVRVCESIELVAVVLVSDSTDLSNSIFSAITNVMGVDVFLGAFVVAEALFV